MKIINWHCCRYLLHRLHMKLNWFLGRYVVSGELRYLRKRVKELEAAENQDIRFLRYQLTKLRAEKTELLSQTDSLRDKFAALLNMTEKQLQEIACQYDLWQADSKSSWVVATDCCVFCGCGLETIDFGSRRDALLYMAMLQTVGYRPKHNLSCPSCYEEYEKSIALPDE